MAYEAWQQSNSVQQDCIQATMLMVLPPACHASKLKSSQKMEELLQDCCLDQGIGYSRLCCQLVAHASGLDDIWLLDDNVLQCWELDFKAGLERDELYHRRESLKQVTFGHAMQALESAVLHRDKWKVRIAVLHCKDKLMPTKCTSSRN